jgi:hypothetical protein
MKLTKQLEAEIKKFMKTYWDTYLKGDLRTWASFLPADYKNIGGTEEEIWNSRKEILDYTKRISKQMVGQAEIRNTKTQIIPYDPYMMVHEFTQPRNADRPTSCRYGRFPTESHRQPGECRVRRRGGGVPA